MEKEFNDLLKERYGIVFKNQALLDEAMTQASYVNEHPGEGLKFYERLEFLGDAVYQLVVSDYIFKRFPDFPQGRLTRLRAAMVDEHSFSRLARECHFDKYIRLGKGEERSNARDRDSLLCDIFESFIGAVYLDQGLDVVKKFCHIVIFPKLDEGWFNEFFDHKTQLQEVAQGDGPADIDYRLVDENRNDLERKFTMQVSLNGKPLGRGSGRNKKDAEQRAAQAALEGLGVNPNISISNK